MPKACFISREIEALRMYECVLAHGARWNHSGLGLVCFLFSWFLCFVVVVIEMTKS